MYSYFLVGDSLQVASLLRSRLLDVTQRSPQRKTYNTRQYQFTLSTNTGKKVSITAFGRDTITGLETAIALHSFEKLHKENPQTSLDEVSFNYKPCIVCKN